MLNLHHGQHGVFPGLELLPVGRLLVHRVLLEQREGVGCDDSLGGDVVDGLGLGALLDHAELGAAEGPDGIVVNTNDPVAGSHQDLVQFGMPGRPHYVATAHLPTIVSLQDLLT